MPVTAEGTGVPRDENETKTSDRANNKIKEGVARSDNCDYNKSVNVVKYASGGEMRRVPRNQSASPEQMYPAERMVAPFIGK